MIQSRLCNAKFKYFLLRLLSYITMFSFNFAKTFISWNIQGVQTKVWNLQMETYHKSTVVVYQLSPLRPFDLCYSEPNHRCCCYIVFCRYWNDVKLATHPLQLIVKANIKQLHVVWLLMNCILGRYHATIARNVLYPLLWNEEMFGCNYHTSTF